MLYDLTYHSYEDLLLQLLTEEHARRFLAHVRWGGHPKCSHCNHQGPCSYDNRRKIFYCGKCAKQFSVTTGTIFEKTQVPILKWFKAIFEIANGNISSVRLAKKIGVNQLTAWKMEQKIRQCLKEDLDNVILSNIVEADTSVITPNLDRDFSRRYYIKRQTRLARKDRDINEERKIQNQKTVERRRRKKLGLPSPPSGRPKGVKDSKSRARRGEVPKRKRKQYYQYQKWILGIVERGGKVYLQILGQHSAEVKAKKIADIMKVRVAEGTKVVTDGGKEFIDVPVHFPNHEIIVHDPWIEYKKKDGTIATKQIRQFVKDGRHTNTIESTWSHLKRLLWGNHIQITYGHANRYLYEFAFRRNNKELSDAEKFQFILKNALKMTFPYHEFKVYTRVYKTNDNGVVIGERQFWNRAA